MAKFYKKQSPYIKKLSLMAVSQVAFAIIPILLLISYLWYIGDKNFFIGFAFIAAIVLALVLYVLVAQRYKILLSGYRGERELKKIIKRIRLPGNAAVFINLPIRYKKSFSELDMLIVSEKGILLIEVKNHSGVIYGSDYDEHWIQTKKKQGKQFERNPRFLSNPSVRASKTSSTQTSSKGRNGHKNETRMDNPFRQIKRQRDILKSILRSEGYEVWIENVVFFSNPSVSLKLKLHESNHVCGNGGELVSFINNFYNGNKIADKSCYEIINILKNHEV